MDTIEIDPNIKKLISELEDQLHTFESDVVQKAVLNLLEKIQKKSRFMSFAGVIKDEEATDWISTIRQNRRDKDMDSDL